MPEEPTTPDLEELTRRNAEAAGRGDFDTVLAHCRAGAIWDTSAIGFGVFEGREAIRALFEDWVGVYEDFDEELEAFRALGNDVSLAVLHQRGRLKGSSGLVNVRYAAVATWADGLIERVTTYLDIEEARAAAERLAKERE